MPRQLMMTVWFYDTLYSAEASRISIVIFMAIVKVAIIDPGSWQPSGELSFRVMEIEKRRLGRQRW